MFGIVNQTLRPAARRPRASLRTWIESCDALSIREIEVMTRSEERVWPSIAEPGEQVSGKRSMPVIA
jgi:hypothetical protein